MTINQFLSLHMNLQHFFNLQKNTVSQIWNRINKLNMKDECQ